jgi:hypothetical protein
MARFFKHQYKPSPALILSFIALSVALAGSANALQKRAGVHAGNRTTGADARTAQVSRADGLRLWGVINANGSLVRGAGVTRTSRPRAGAYHVIFNRDVRKCGYLASLGRVGAQLAQGGQIGTGGLPRTPNGVWVRTRTSAGDLEDRSFHIAVIC